MYENKADNSSINFSKIYFFVVLIILFLIFLQLFMLYRGSITGKTSANLDLVEPVSGRNIEGKIIYKLGDNSLPYDSVVSVSINSYTKTIPLSNLLTDKELSSLFEIVEFKPSLEVVLSIYTYRNSGSSKPPTYTQQPPPFETKGVFTGEILSSYEITKYVRKGEYSVLQLRPDEIAFVKQVHLRGKNIDPSYISLLRDDNILIVKTDFSEYVNGIDPSKIEDISLDLKKFNIAFPSTKQALIEVSFIYKDEKLAKVEKSVAIKSPQTKNVHEKLEQISQPPLIASDSSNMIEPHEKITTKSITSISQCQEEPICTLYGPCSTSSLWGIKEEELSKTFVQLSHCTACGYVFSVYTPCSNQKPSINYIPIPNSFPKDPKIISTGGENQSPKFVRNIPLDGTIPKQSRKFINFVQDDLSVRDSLTVEVDSEDVVKIKLNGIEHHISAEVKSSEKALIKVRSEPQEKILSVGESGRFDTNADGIFDLVVVLNYIKKNKAFITISQERYNKDLIFLSPDEKALTLIREDISLPVAHVILNPYFPTLRILLVQSNNSLPSHCYNSIKDENEIEIDCGGESCKQCKKEKRDYSFAMSFIISLLMVFTIFIISNKKFR